MLSDRGAQIEFLEANPKRTNSAAALRYDAYKRARTVGEASDAGASKGDLKNDLGKGYLKFLALPGAPGGGVVVGVVAPAAVPTPREARPVAKRMPTWRNEGDVQAALPRQAASAAPTADSESLKRQRIGEPLGRRAPALPTPDAAPSASFAPLQSEAAWSRSSAAAGLQPLVATGSSQASGSWRASNALGAALAQRRSPDASATSSRQPPYARAELQHVAAATASSSGDESAVVPLLYGRPSVPLSQRIAARIGSEALAAAAAPAAASTATRSAATASTAEVARTVREPAANTSSVSTAADSSASAVAAVPLAAQPPAFSTAAMTPRPLASVAAATVAATERCPTGAGDGTCAQGVENVNANVSPAVCETSAASLDVGFGTREGCVPTHGLALPARSAPSAANIDVSTANSIGIQFKWPADFSPGSDAATAIDDEDGVSDSELLAACAQIEAAGQLEPPLATPATEPESPPRSHAPRLQESPQADACEATEHKSPSCSDASRPLQESPLAKALAESLARETHQAPHAVADVAGELVARQLPHDADALVAEACQLQAADAEESGCEDGGETITLCLRLGPVAVKREPESEEEAAPPAHLAEWPSESADGAAPPGSVLAQLGCRHVELGGAVGAAHGGAAREDSQDDERRAQFEAAQAASYEVNVQDRAAREAREREAVVKDGDLGHLSALDEDLMSVIFCSDGMFTGPREGELGWLARAGHRAVLYKYLELKVRATRWYPEPASAYFEERRHSLEKLLADGPQAVAPFLEEEIGKVEEALFAMPERGRYVPRLFAPQAHSTAEGGCVELD